MTKLDPQVAVYAWTLEFKDAAKNSDKFYNVFVAENGMYWLHWGRRGSTGQSTVGVLSFDAARDIGLRQVFAKKSKGYRQTNDGLKFMMQKSALDSAYRAGEGYLMHRTLVEALAHGQFEGVKEAVLLHYAEFAEQAQRLLAGAQENDFADVLAQHEELKKVWEDIAAKHAEVSIAMDLVGQTIAMRLMTSSV